jgi:hypothetical protein
MLRKAMTQAVRRTISQNELDRARELADWLDLIADEFGSYGIDVEDLRAFARFVRGPNAP